MSSPLAHELAGKIIDVLTQRGHVLLSKGGKSALMRELADRMNDKLATVLGRMPPPGIVDNEVTSTFGDEAVDDTVEDMVEDVAASLMDSEQVEDVFAEDAVIRRDVFRVVKDTLLSADRPWGDAEEADVVVAIETLGYVASKAAQRAGVPMVEAALERAAKMAHAKLLRYSPDGQTATFRAALATPDARLELEEAVADELSNLVDEGKVALPTIERRLPLGRPVPEEERRAARTRVSVAANRTLVRSGCTATWEYSGDDTVLVSLVPMSDQDARTADPHVDAFGRELLMIFGRPRAGAEAPASGLDAWLRLAKAASGGNAPASSPGSKRAAESTPVSKRTAQIEAAHPESQRRPESKRAVSGDGSPKKAVEKKAVEKAPASKKEAAKKGDESAVAKKKAAKEPVAKGTVAKKKAATKEAAPMKAGAKKASVGKLASKSEKPAAKKTAKKR